MYLACKVNECDRVKVRDILNVLSFTANERRSIADAEERLDYTKLSHLAKYAPTNEISLADYSILREKVLSEEQRLIRTLNFNFKRYGQQAL